MMKYVTLVQYKNSIGIFRVVQKVGTLQELEGNVLKHLEGFNTENIEHVVTVPDNERTIALHIARWGKPVIETPSYGEKGYNGNGLMAGVKNYKWCMTCGDPLPQHYLDLAQGPQLFVKSGYPICDKASCQAIDQRFHQQVQHGGIYEKYPIADIWHVYNPVTRNKLVRAENGAILGEEPYKGEQ